MQQATTRRHLAAASALVFAAASLPSSSYAESADEAAVKKAIDDLGKAMIATDKATLDALLADQLSYGHSTGKMETMAMFVDEFVSKKTVAKSVVVKEPTITIVGNIAIARYKLAFEYEEDGKPGVSKPGVLQIWTKDGGTWKLLARQAFRLPHEAVRFATTMSRPAAELPLRPDEAPP